jgi:hypothetical protein
MVKYRDEWQLFCISINNQKANSLVTLHGKPQFARGVEIAFSGQELLFQLMNVNESDSLLAF